jgi:uncharacterized protein YaiL (DUF2058 family)
MQSLKDKLLKAGLVSEEQAKKAEEAKKAPPPAAARPQRERAPERKPAEHRSAPRPAAAAGPRIPKLPPMAGSKEAQRNDAKKQVHLDRQIREKVLAAQVPAEAGSHTFYFVTRKQKLRRMEMSDAQAKLLEEGKLAVVERPDPDKIDHALVPPEVAAELIGLSDKVVRFWNREGQAVGFLSEAEIASRAKEADEPEAAAPAEAPATAETWITIKRA